MTGMGKTFIYDRMRDGTFPKQIQLGSRKVVWNEQEVTKWMADRMASSSTLTMSYILPMASSKSFRLDNVWNIS
jgi:prophage regulatory protein